MTQKNKTSAYSSLTGIHRAVPIILFAIAVFTMFCFITQDIGALGHAISTVFLGLFSYGAYAVPLLLALHAIFYPSDIRENRLVSRIIFSLVAITFISALAYAITYWSTDLVFSPVEFFKNGQNSQGGGFLGGIVGFCLVKIFGRIGLVIIATAVFAIYILYFFTTGQRNISKFFYNALKVIVILLAYAEMGIKTFFKKIKNAKSDKMRREAEEKNGKLTEDDFFAVDNGMKKLSVSELGIKETRDDATSDGNTLLHEKIFYKSAVSPEEAEEMERREKAEEFFYAEMEKQEKEESAPTHRRLLNVTYDDPDSKIGRTVKPEEPKEDIVIANTSAVTDDNADAVFTQGFDPFGMMMSEELASKPSSRSLKDDNVRARKVTEDISELTEADIEREKRVLEFERRKAALLESRRAIPVDNDGEFTGTPKTVEFREHTNEKQGDSIEETTSSSFIFDKVEKRAEPPKTIPANYTSIGFGNEEVRVNDALSKPEFTSPETIYSYEPPKEEAPKQVNYTVYDAAKNDTAPASLPYVEEESVPLFEKKTTLEFTSAYSPVTEVTPTATESAPIVEEQSVPLFEKKTTLEFTPAYSTATEVTSAATESVPVVEEHNAPLFEEKKTPEFTPAYSPVVDTIPVINVSAPASEEREINEEPTFTMNVEPVEEKEEFSYTATKDFDKEETNEYVPEFKPYQVVTPEEASEPVVATTEFKDETPEEVNTLQIEREYVGDENTPDAESFFQGSSEDEEYSEPDEDEDEADGLSDGEEISTPDDDGDAFEANEIPPEERNPVVEGFLNMFPALHDDEPEETASDDNSHDYELVSPDEIEDEVSPDEYIDTFNSDDEDEDGEDDIPPFEHSTVRLEPKAKVEKKEEPPVKKKPDFSNYKMPSIDLLGLDPETDDDNSDINENTKILIDTLASFNVTASIKGVDRGPRITRYEVVPARGVKVQSITNLYNDIALNLAKEGIRMEAPIPGKSAIGFEIPNKNPRNVRLRELLECDEFGAAGSKTFVGIGKDVAGNPVFGDIAKYPHALICGATGMGKSVCINSILVSMLYKARPDEVRLIMIDPKKVEFRMYSGIPHLLIPVITESKQAAGALMWAVEEMERRYELIEKNNIRNIEAYNEKVRNNPSLGDPLPKIVIVIDELADLMMMVRDPVEDLIMRIAQKARAAGIHLIIGTQRPSVQVITGAIKANIPSRISCKVTSQVDSRTIFDMGGAEKLLNRGDMLYWPVDRTKALRVQGAFVSDQEVEDVMEFLKSQVSEGAYDEEIFAEINKAAQKCGNKKSGGVSADDIDDDGEECGYYSDQQFLDAVELAIRSKKVSTSLLQRKLSIGYGKAAKYIDAMEEIGIVSEPKGQKPRDVLLSMDEWHEKLSRVDLD
jgi:S-DNA-T family DNA segregation ATPase FtsK/SpoIIIE